MKLRDLTDLPIVIKGILTAEDTEMAVRTGMSAVIVSSHGARQMDHVGGAIEALPECVQAAGGKIPVLIDGGFRRGSDVLKALALGATAVGIARPYLWGLTTFGQQGVARVIELLRTELALDMACPAYRVLRTLTENWSAFATTRSNLHVSPRGEAKWVRGPSGRGASRLARAGVLEQYIEHGKQAQRSHGGRIACFDRRVVRNTG